MNSEAKFSKVYCEGVNQCFLRSANFKDDVIRNFYNLKFQEFQKFGDNGDFLRRDHSTSFFHREKPNVLDKLDFADRADFPEEHSEKGDFAEEHLERADFAEEHSERGDFTKEHSERWEN